jgi:tRNA-Thr(GGU) m(6)t(6)A37 methyltransferase TsaA
MDGSTVEITPIGVLRTCFGGKFAVPRQPGMCPSAWGRLVFHESFRHPDALRGIEGFSHLWLIWHMHLTAGRGWTPTVRPPRLGGNRRVGVFASRATHRPNALGLSLVRLEAVDETAADGPALWLGGVDLCDGTPVFDIKPYLPYAEAPENPRGGYAGEAVPLMEVVVDAAARESFEALPKRARNVIREVLALDPRPAINRSDAGDARVHGALICGRDVRFAVARGICRVVEITAPQGPPAPPLPPVLSNGI